MKTFTVYADGNDRIELFNNQTGMAFIENEFYPITNEDFNYFNKLSEEFGNTFKIESYFKCFGKAFDVLCENERVENESK